MRHSVLLAMFDHWSAPRMASGGDQVVTATIRAMITSASMRTFGLSIERIEPAS